MEIAKNGSTEFQYWCVLQYNQKSGISDQNCTTR